MLHCFGTRRRQRKDDAFVILAAELRRAIHRIIHGDQTCVRPGPGSHAAKIVERAFTTCGSVQCKNHTAAIAGIANTVFMAAEVCGAVEYAVERQKRTDRNITVCSFVEAVNDLELRTGCRLAWPALIHR